MTIESGLTALDVGVAGRPTTAGAQRRGFAGDALFERLRLGHEPQRDKQAYPLEALLHERFQFDRERLGVADFHGVGEWAHIVHRHPNQLVGNQLPDVEHGELSCQAAWT